jgi:putative nucleotidyltransferase with HDIG domain
VTDTSDGLELLQALESHVDFLYAQSVAVSLYSVLIARALSWGAPSNLFKIAAAGLFHDIGLKEIDKEILLKHRKDWTPQEIRAYESHPTRGVEILRQMPGMPTEVLEVVKQHHEDFAGRGFPAKMKAKTAHPLARLVAVTNQFCGMALKGATSAGMSAHDAIAEMERLDAERLDPLFFQGLQKVFKYKQPEKPKKRG